MSGQNEPWIPADVNIKELTYRVIIIGILRGGVMTAANAYLGLYVGMTVSASIASWPMHPRSGKRQMKEMIRQQAMLKTWQPAPTQKVP